MFTFHQLENILFIDIETASGAPEYNALDTRMQTLWDRKAQRYMRNSDSPSSPEILYTEKAGIHAEFGKIVCISCGYLRFDSEKGQETPPLMKLKSFYGTDEQALLVQFKDIVQKFMRKEGRNLCAHNGKEFDYPYIARRCIVNSLPIPEPLRIEGKKPWEVQLLDTMELWKFGDYKAYTSLDLLTAILDIPSPKEDLDGSQIGHVYWQEKDYERIKTYCEKDVLTTAQVMLRMSRLPMAQIASSDEVEV